MQTMDDNGGPCRVRLPASGSLMGEARVTPWGMPMIQDCDPAGQRLQLS